MDRFRVLPGLPATGPMPLSFSATGGGKFREGFVVEFQPTDREAWVGNFVGGLTRYSNAILHPNGRFVVVVSQGQAYIIDPQRRTLVETFGGVIQDLIAVPGRGLLIFQTPFDFLAIDSKRRVWKTRRLAVEDFRSVLVDGDRLVGEARDFGELWIPLEINLASGKVKGGSPGFKRWWEC